MRKFSLRLFFIAITIIFSLKCMAELYTGNCGTDLKFKLDTETGILEITGSGLMSAFSSSTSSPWYSNRDCVQKVLFEGAITRIGSYAFYGCQNLTSIKIPETVTSIGENAFYDCSKLDTINIPSKLSEISNKVFYGCSSLRFANLPEGLKTIREYAFYGCKGLSSIIIPSTVTSISSNAFSGCYFARYNIVNKSGVSSSPWGAKLVDSENVSGLLTTGNVVNFCRRYATDITIPGNIISIDYAALQDCDKLKTLTISKSLQLEYSTFKGCTGTLILKELPTPGRSSYNSPYYGSEFTKIVFADGITSIPSYDFNNLTTVKKLEFPSSLQDIKSTAFKGCTALDSIILPEDLITVGVSAFSSCNSVSYIEIPDFVMTIGDNAFYGCMLLKENFVNKSLCSSSNNWGATLYDRITDDGLCIINHEVIKCYPKSEKIVVPSDIEIIGKQAFSNCSTLTSVTLPEGLTTIRDFAFRSCM